MSRLDQVRTAWDRSFTVGDEALAEVNYVKEMVQHPVSVGTGLAALAVGLPLMVVAGPVAAAMPFVAWVTGESVAGLIVPNSRVFRGYINRRKKAEARENLRGVLIRELYYRVPDPSKRPEAEQEDSGGWVASLFTATDPPLKIRRGDRVLDRDQAQRMWDNYYNMLAEWASLRKRKLATSDTTPVTDHDLERLSESTVTYLQKMLQYVRLIEWRRDSDLNAIRTNLAQYEAALEQAKLSPTARAQLEQHASQLRKMLVRHETLPGDILAAEASLTAHHAAFIELCQRMAAPRVEDEGYLSDAIEVVIQQEQIEFGVDTELAEFQTKYKKQLDAARNTR